MAAPDFVTMQQVADAAGVSKMTVSLALRRHASIPKSTRTRVEAQARRLGYHTNPLVSALMTNLRGKRTAKAPPTIAFVTTYPSATASSGLRRLYRGARERAERLGYRAVMFSLADLHVTAKRLGGILQARGVRGAILAPFPAPVSEFSMRWPLFASAAIARSLLRPELHRAHSNQYHAVMMAFDHAWIHGYRRVAFAAEFGQSDRSQHWWRNGFRLAWERRGGADEDCLVHLPLHLEENEFMQWYRAVRPEVILGIDRRILDFLLKNNVRVPQEVGYIVLDLQEETAGCAGVDQNYNLIAAAAVDIVVEQLHNNEYGVPKHPKSVMIEGSWQPGRTIVRLHPDTSLPRRRRATSRS